MIRFTPPIRFVAFILTLWVGLRIVFWIPADVPSTILYQPNPFLPGLPTLPLPSSQITDLRTGAAERAIAPAPQASGLRHSTRLTQLAAHSVPAVRHSRDGAGRIARPCGVRCTQNLLAAYMPPFSQPMLMRFARRSSYVPPPSVDGAAPRLTLSAWAQWRSGDGIDALANDGELGGSQAGVRARYRLLGAAGLQAALSARLSRPIERNDGAEAAIGIAVRPAEDVPVEIMVERRIALDQGGRDAWAFGFAGGISREPLVHGLELDGYAQAGIVGAESRDLYADAALIVSRPVADAERGTVALGAGVWAGAQPGASRLDIGPEASVRLPAGDGGFRLSVSWRQRIAGSAGPGSGPVIAFGADF